MRKSRLGEYTCHCTAYSFPHRFGGGNCSGLYIAEDQWNTHHGGGDCKECLYNNSTEDSKYCEVVEGGESIKHCLVYQDFIRANAIKLSRDR